MVLIAVRASRNFGLNLKLIDMTDITKLISLILAISVAGERLVMLFKTQFPWLAGAPNATQAADPNVEKKRKVILMLLSFVCCTLTAILLAASNGYWYINLGGSIGEVTVFLFGLLGTGGSAFWTSILGYVKSVDDIKVQQKLQKVMETQEMRFSINKARLESRADATLRQMRSVPPPQFNH
jgi:hypothetical protein